MKARTEVVSLRGGDLDGQTREVIFGRDFVTFDLASRPSTFEVNGKTFPSVVVTIASYRRTAGRDARGRAIFEVAHSALGAALGGGRFEVEIGEGV